MLIAARNGFMVGKSILPPGARWVEYLESTGTQWIDTGVIGSSNSKVEITASSTNTSNILSLFGARNANKNNRPSFCIWQRSFVDGGYHIRFDYNSATADSLVQGDWNTNAINSIIKDRRYNYVNGVQMQSNNSFSFTLPVSFFLGTINGSGSPAGYYFIGKIYSCKIWNNSTLVRGFRPIAIGNTGYMLDLLTGDYLQYGNKGTGDFVIGPDI